jgi:hypothetical protein
VAQRGTPDVDGLVDGLADGLAAELADVLGDTPADGLVGWSGSPVDPHPPTVSTTSASPTSRQVPDVVMDTPPVFTFGGGCGVAPRVLGTPDAGRSETRRDEGAR